MQSSSKNNKTVEKTIFEFKMITQKWIKVQKWFKGLAFVSCNGMIHEVNDAATRNSISKTIHSSTRMRSILERETYSEPKTNDTEAYHQN